MHLSLPCGCSCNLLHMLLPCTAVAVRCGLQPVAPLPQTIGLRCMLSQTVVVLLAAVPAGGRHKRISSRHGPLAAVGLLAGISGEKHAQVCCGACHLPAMLWWRQQLCAIAIHGVADSPTQPCCICPAAWWVLCRPASADRSRCPPHPCLQGWRCYLAVWGAGLVFFAAHIWLICELLLAWRQKHAAVAATRTKGR